jgi:hypothetical protein
MSLVPSLRLFPTPIGGRCRENICEIRRESGLIVFGNQDGEALSLINLGTAFGLGLHSVESEHPSFDESRRQKRFESTDFMLLVLDVDLEKDNAVATS